MLSASQAQPQPVHDIAIIGYGPTGATLAGLLGRRGLDVAVFDKALDIYRQPRAVGFDHDAMRIFQHVGIADALEPHVAPFNDGEYLGIGGRVIQRVKRMAPPYPQGWEPGYTCDQPGVEAVLRAAIAGMPNVAVTLGCELASFTQEADQVRIGVRDTNGKEVQHAARYLVGCDGASSPVRRALGIGLEDFEYDHAWAVVDVKVKPAHLAQLPPTNVQYCQPERPSSFITCPGNHRRWEFMTLAGEERDGEIPEERLWELLSRWLRPGEAEIWRSAAYRFHALIAHQWRCGRVLLAGDAAHQTPPFLGQGMCQGLRDAGNLAWKLDAVLRGCAPESLLDSYTTERRPHVAATTRLAKELGNIVSERDPGKARARDAAMLAKGGGEAQTLIRQELIPGLTAGLIDAGAPLAGKVFPQPGVRTPDAGEVRLDDVTGPCWRLVVAGTVSLALVAAARSHNMKMVVLDSAPVPFALHVAENAGLLRRWLAAANCRGALVRPDHYVFGGFASDDQASRLLDRLAAALQPAPPTHHPAAQAASQPAAA